MKKLLFVITAVFSLAQSGAQTTLSFTDLAPMPTGLGAITSAANDKTIYVCNGFSNTVKFTGLVEKYDITGNSWTTLTSDLIPKQFASSAIINDELYVFNGDLENKKFNNKTEIVDLKTGHVTLSEKNPQPAHAAGVVTWGGKIYSFGGKISQDGPDYSDKLFEFDPAKKKWKELASMPEKKETKGVVVNGRIYTIGGYNGKVSDKVLMYDISENKWVEMLTLPFGISGNAVTAYGTKIYSVFDFTNQTLVGCYDVSSNTFTVYKEENMVGRRHAGAHVINGKLYIVGGNTSHLQNSCLNSLQAAEVK